MIGAQKELAEARQALSSLLGKCRSVEAGKTPPKAQAALLRRRIDALELALSLVDREIAGEPGK